MKVQRVPDEKFGVICQNSTKYEFCIINLQSWSGVEHLDLDELGNIAILSATIQARLNKHLMQAFLDYNVTLGKLEAAYRLSDLRDYVRMKELVNDAMKMSVKCEDLNRVNYYISPTEMYSYVLEIRNSIALAILDELDG